MTRSAPPDITLQINVCAGDLAYAGETIPSLVAAHRADVADIILVADACPPQPTPWVPESARLEPATFVQRVAALGAFCDSLLARRIVDRVEWLRPSDDRRALNRRYCGQPTHHSHDHLGHAFSAYFLGWDVAATRYVAHFDADIILWQQSGYSWLQAAISALERDESLLAASPRIAPPPLRGELVQVGRAGSGWQPSWPLVPVAGGWRSPWFSTRCHLMDVERLRRFLPLTPSRGAAADRGAAVVDRIFTPLYERGIVSVRRGRLLRALAARVPPFPLPPEVLLHENAQRRGFGCLYLDDRRAWFLHPDTKSEDFLHLLSRLLRVAAVEGRCPEEQQGVSGVQLAAWEAFEA